METLAHCCCGLHRPLVAEIVNRADYVGHCSGRKVKDVSDYCIGGVVSEETNAAVHFAHSIPTNPCVSFRSQ